MASLVNEGFGTGTCAFDSTVIQGIITAGSTDNQYEIVCTNIGELAPSAVLSIQFQYVISAIGKTYADSGATVEKHFKTLSVELTINSGDLGTTPWFS